MSLVRDLVSVLLPVCNGERFLANAIESVLRQSYKHLELIIFDDFSSDYSLSIIESFAGRDRRIKHWRSAQRVGLFENYNQCLGQSEGEFILPFAQDDFLYANALEVCVKTMQQAPEVGIVAFKNNYVDSFNVPIHDIKLKPDVFAGHKPIMRTQALEKCLFPLNNFVGEISTVMFAAKHQGKGFDSRMHQYADLDLWLRILLESDLIKLDDCLAQLRRHPGCASLATSRGMMGACDLIKIGRKYSKVVEALGKTEDYFFDLAIKDYLAHAKDLIEEGIITTDYLRRSEDLHWRAKADASKNATAATTQAFSALAQALAGEEMECLSLSMNPNENNNSLLQDLIDFREFSMRLINLMAKSEQPQTGYFKGARQAMAISST